MTLAADVEPSSPRRWWFGMGDLLCLLLVVGMGQRATQAILCDPGLGWRLRSPDWLLQNRGWPTTEPFAAPSADQPWLVNQWLGDVPIWSGWQLAEFNGVVAAALLLLLIAYRLLYGFMRRDGLSWPTAAVWTLVAALASYYAWVARPLLITFIAVTVLTRVLVLFHEDRLSVRRLAWLPLLFFVWGNSHGGFVIGLVMIGLAVAVEGVGGWLHPDHAMRPLARRRLPIFLMMGLLCFVATLLNPYGYRVYPWSFKLLGNEYFMNLNDEWRSPDFHSDGAIRFALLLVAFPVFLALTRYRASLLALAFSALWMYLALQSSRHVPLWVMVTVPLLARASAQIDWFQTKYSEGEWAELIRLRSRGWLGLGVIGIALMVWARVAPPLEPAPQRIASQGLNVLLDRYQPDETVLNHPNYGGYLTLRGWPALRVWLDDRHEIHPESLYQDYFRVEQTAPNWEEQLREWNPTWIVIPPRTPLAYRLAERPTDWEQVHQDGLVAIFRQRMRK